MNVVGRICCCEIRCQEFLNYLVESEAGRANFHGQVAGDVGRRPTIKMHKVQSRNTRHKIRGRKQNNQLPLIGVPGDEAWPERPLPGDALLQLCHRRHAHLSLSLSPEYIVPLSLVRCASRFDVRTQDSMRERY
jgi:hypothetical protein